jgi:hypothetical protein
VNRKRKLRRPTLRHPLEVKTASCESEQLSIIDNFTEAVENEEGDVVESEGASDEIEDVEEKQKTEEGKIAEAEAKPESDQQQQKTDSDHGN